MYMLPAVRRVPQIIVDNLRKIDRRHDAIALCVHADPIDPGNIKTRDVESILQLPVRAKTGQNSFANCVLFVFQ